MERNKRKSACADGAGHVERWNVGRRSCRDEAHVYNYRNVSGFDDTYVPGTTVFPRPTQQPGVGFMDMADLRMGFNATVSNDLIN